jgi:hypothetical protein
VRLTVVCVGWYQYGGGQIQKSQKSQTTSKSIFEVKISGG